MNLEQIVSVVGAAVSTFLLVGAVTIEVFLATVGGEIGPGIVGVFVGVVAGLVVAAAAWWRWPAMAERGRTVTLAYAVFGLVVAFLAALSYVNVPGADLYLDVRTNLVVAAVVALLVGLGRWRQRRATFAS